MVQVEKAGMQATPFDTNNLLDSVTTVLVVIDNSLRIVYANHAGQALFATGTKQLDPSANWA